MKDKNVYNYPDSLPYDDKENYHLLTYQILRSTYGNIKHNLKSKYVIQFNVC